MKLVLAIAGEGVRIGALTDISNVILDDVPYFKIRSEDYLQQIEHDVERNGGWDEFTDVYISVVGESFTSLRGLVTLVNALSPLHGLNMYTFTDSLEKCVVAKSPIEPQYSSEPNITKKR